MEKYKHVARIRNIPGVRLWSLLYQVPGLAIDQVQEREDGWLRWESPTSYFSPYPRRPVGLSTGQSVEVTARKGRSRPRSANTNEHSLSTFRRTGRDVSPTYM